MDNILTWQNCLPKQIVHDSPKLAAAVQVPSLTAALRSLGADFSVRLLYLGSSNFSPIFAGIMPYSKEQTWFCRDVLLCLNRLPVVWARSLCTQSAAGWINVLDCGTRPLGERLFDGSLPLTRSAFEYAVLPEQYPLAGFDGYGVLMRRSLFEWQGEKLGLAECFLPDFATMVLKTHDNGTG